jgi:hypothetical protein
MRSKSIDIASHPYDDDDMNYINEARNTESGFSYLKSTGSNDSRILIRSDGTLVHDEYCKLTIEMPNGYTVDRLGRFSYRDTFRTFLNEQILYIAVIKSLDQQCFPLKILFPYRYGSFHWNVGEVIVDPARQSISATAYDPYGRVSALPEEIGEEVSTVFRQFITGEQDFTVSSNTTGRIGRVQRGGLACGAFSAAGMHNLKTKSYTHIWDGILTAGRVKSDLELRMEDLATVQRFGSEEGKANFLETRADTMLGALYSGPTTSAYITTAATRTPKSKTKSSLSKDEIKILENLVTQLENLREIGGEFKVAVDVFLKGIDHSLKQPSPDFDEIVNANEAIGAIFQTHGKIINPTIYQEIINHFEFKKNAEADFLKRTYAPTLYSFNDILYAKSPVADSRGKSFFHCQLHESENHDSDFSRPSGKAINVSNLFAEKTSDLLEESRKAQQFSDLEVSAIILVAIKNQGFTGNSDAGLIADFKKIYQSAGKKLPERKIDDAYIAKVRKFSKDFQDNMRSNDFFTGNSAASNPEVGLRLKRLTIDHACIYCGDHKFIEDMNKSLYAPSAAPRASRADQRWVSGRS